MLLKGKTIFLVEDNVANAGIMLTTLQIAGAKTHFDRWGKDTIAQLKQIQNIDLILLDLMLHGGISGYDVFARIKAIPELSHIPIVIVSASNATAEMDKARQLGFNGYIIKPIEFTIFPRLLMSIFDGQEIWDDAFV